MTKYLMIISIALSLAMIAMGLVGIYLSTRPIPEVEPAVPLKMEPLEEYPCDPDCKG